jgi:steroid 5-alpha reductase family enzyme
MRSFIMTDVLAVALNVQLLAKGRLQHWVGRLQMVRGIWFNIEENLTVYREVLKEKISPALFFVFNVLFISLAQSILLFLVATPTYVILLTTRLGEGMSTSDTVFARVLMGLVLLEFFADQQQWGMKIFFPAFQPLICSLQTTKTQRNPT